MSTQVQLTRDIVYVRHHEPDMARMVQALRIVLELPKGGSRDGSADAQGKEEAPEVADRLVRGNES